ncbi:Alpha/beta hydrolase family-domain-containing protein [Mycena vulgaris]|nr:Alpha/beta hydrolase family-domain-containing protein [Mycena vulgaris]
MLLRALSLLLIQLFVGASGASCGCSSVVIPVHVDVLVPKDPTDEFGGLKSNSSSLRRVNDEYKMHGVFCQPHTIPVQNSEVLQLLVHGVTYNSQYWSPPIEEFRNYSYAAFSCDRGLSSLAIDALGAGLSSHPANASDVQYPTGAAALSQLARHLKKSALLPGVKPFKKIIGIGHSAGSALLNFGAIVDGTRSPFDGLILTGSVIFDHGPSSLSMFPSARDADPLRWGALDPAYLTTSNDRTFFYPADPTTFSPRMLQFDAFTKDIASVSMILQVATTSVPALEYMGPVAKVIGSEDQISCQAGSCMNVSALTAAERVTWPAAQSFELVVSQGSGHDINLDFFASGALNTVFGFAKKFSR